VAGASPDHDFVAGLDAYGNVRNPLVTNVGALP